MSEETVEVATEVKQTEEATEESQLPIEPDLSKVLAQTKLTEKTLAAVVVPLPKSK